MRETPPTRYRFASSRSSEYPVSGSFSARVLQIAPWPEIPPLPTGWESA
ncbi:MAG: hypothetical protein WCA21_19215 [Terracidiphilus sp.]